MSRFAWKSSSRHASGILVEHLETAVQMVAESNACHHQTHLQKALDLAAGLDPYLDDSTTQESPALSAIAQN